MPGGSNVLSPHIHHNERNVKELQEESGKWTKMLNQYNNHLLLQQSILNENIEECIKLRQQYKILRPNLRPKQRSVYVKKIARFNAAIDMDMEKIEKCGVYIMILRDNLTLTNNELKEMETYLANLNSVASAVSSSVTFRP